MGVISVLGSRLLPIPVGNGGSRLKAGVLQVSVVLIWFKAVMVRTFVVRVTP